MRAKSFIPLILIGVIVFSLAIIFASAVFTSQAEKGRGVGWSSVTLEQGPPPHDFFEKRGIHPPCMGQTSKLPAHAYTGNKP
jgi:hypothetical protein